MLFIAILAPFLAAVLLGFLQLGIYKLLIKAGRLEVEQSPFFGILLFRGFILVIAVIFVFALLAKMEMPNNEDDPMWSDAAKQGIIEFKYGSDKNKDEEQGAQVEDPESEPAGT
ncbi:MAG: hypothetical protein PF961_09425, partial [Planctomycetota bacterium]|nr:hypothetical protein [Planctomycetota bacterium]